MKLTFGTLAPALSFLIFGLCFIFPQKGLAQAVADQTCRPACRAGFFCHNGACVSPCNPVCGPSEVCTQGGRCVPAQNTSPPVVAPAMPSTGNPAVRATPIPSLSSTQRVPFDQNAYDSALAKKHAGAAMMTIGVLAILGSGVLGFMGGYQGSMSLIAAGIGVAVFGDVMFFPGLALVVVNRNRMTRIEKGLPLTLNDADTLTQFPQTATWGLSGRLAF